MMRPPAGEADPSLRRRPARLGSHRRRRAPPSRSLIQRGRPEGALGVLAGAALMGVSYAAIKGGVTALAAAGSRRPARLIRQSACLERPGGLAPAARFIGRYLVIGVAAWAVLVPLRAHPLGLFAGVTVPVLAIGIEAVRLAQAAVARGAGQSRDELYRRSAIRYP
ncbi:MAG: hypothetical protein MZU84_04105 [Sphingobacterium sp.]|nr:hypothetical protein [Sphingobacterium sp.]